VCTSLTTICELPGQIEDIIIKDVRVNVAYIYVSKYMPEHPGQCLKSSVYLFILNFRSLCHLTKIFGDDKDKQTEII